MSDGVEARLASLRRDQEGTTTRAQLRTLGVSDSTIDRWVVSGRLERCHPGVFTDPARPASHLSALWAAFLAAGADAKVTFESAARLRQLASFERCPVLALSRPHPFRARIAGVVVHQIDDYLPSHVSTIDGLPVSTAERTVVDLAARVGRARLAHVVREGILEGRVAFGTLAETALSVRRRGKPGVLKLAGVLDTLALGELPPLSVLERSVLDAMIRAGLPDPARQVPLPGRELGRGLVDFAFLDGSQLIVEADGRRWHGRLQAIARDRQRDLQTAKLGWLTLRVTWEQMHQDPAQVGTDIAAVHTERLFSRGNDPRMRG